MFIFLINHYNINHLYMEALTGTVESIKAGTLVKRTPTAKKTYLRGEYNRELKKYSLTDYNDINAEVFVKKGTVLILDWETTNEDEF
jgi:hypothetical protein